MKRFRVRSGWAGWGVVVVLSAAPALAQTDASKNTNAAEPFYRKYLIFGNPLDEEIRSMEQKVDANPNDATLRNDFANLLALRHFPKEAAEQYEMAAKLDKTNFISDYNLGILRETEGKTSDAIAAYKKSIARKPGFPQARFRLGRLYEFGGNLDAAVEQYAKALRIEPAMRNPRRNPLVIDSRLMYRVTLTNYERDVATVTLDRDVSFVEEPAFRHAAVDRPLSSEDVAPDDSASAPREVGPATGAGTGAAPAGAGAKRPASRTSTTPPTGEPPARSRTGSRPRTARPGQPVPPPGVGAPSAPEAAPPPAAEEPPFTGEGGNPPERVTVPEIVPTPVPEELEPS